MHQAGAGSAAAGLSLVIAGSNLDRAKNCQRQEGHEGDQELDELC